MKPLLYGHAGTLPAKGLSESEARKLIEQYGPNEIVKKKTVSPLSILLKQFTSPLIIILIAAAFVSYLIGYLPGQESNIADTVLILVIVLMSGIFGFIQDYRAEKTIEALQKLSTPKARVIRDGVEHEIPATDVVPGDLLVIEPGDIIAADGVIKDSFHLEVDESILTGESAALGKQKGDEVFMNASVTAGNALVEVKHTGMQTRIGKIAGKLQELKEDKTTFELELERLSKHLSLLILMLTVVIAIVGLLKYDLFQSIMTAISLAVAAIPEGLPAVVVLALAAGARAMFKKNAMIRRLSIVESIGAVNVICTDKTGTLTKNEMTVTVVYANGKEREVTQLKSSGGGQTLRLLFTSGLLCNNVLVQKGEEGRKKYLGEQTEVAIYKASEKLLPANYSRHFHKVNEISFNSRRKMMSVLVEDRSGQLTVFSKGAPEVLLTRCDRILENDGTVRPLSEKDRQDISEQNKKFAAQALRVLGFAFRPADDHSLDENKENNLIWLGLMAMIDPPAENVAEALEECKIAGIRTIMITGDNPFTAEAIAKQLGLETRGVLTGAEIDDMSDGELATALEKGVNIFARTTPFHKLRILQSIGSEQNVAMTGDGVNDALALKQADVGIAMGKRGTEVAKQASDIVLLDDNFSTIKEAIKQGRTIFNNIRKFIDYLLTCNLAEVGIILIATLAFKMDGPVLLAVQILWINLLTDGLVALALGVDPPAGDVMKKPPRKRNAPLISRQLAWLIGTIGFKKMVLLLVLLYLALPLGIDTARTVLLTGVVLFEFVRIGAIRYMEALTFWSNKWLVGALALSVLLQLFIVYSPVNTYFSLVPLGWYEWSLLLGGMFLGYLLAVLITEIILRKVPED